MADLTDEQLAELERLQEAATPGPWESWRQGNQYLGTTYMPTARGVAASVVKGPLRPWNPHAMIAFGVKAEQHEEVRFIDADADLVVAMRNALPELLRSARLAKKAEAFLREHGEELMINPMGFHIVERCGWELRVLLKEFGIK